MKQLRLTTSTPGFFGSVNEPLVKETGEIITLSNIKAPNFYIHDDAEVLAGYDIPIVLSGDMNQLNLPVEKQNIMLVLPSGEYKCKATVEKCGFDMAYLLTLK